MTEQKDSVPENQRLVPSAFTVDVEDYFMVSAFEQSVRFEDWPAYEQRVERNTERLLELLAEEAVKATFFVLGWVAEKYPQIVRAIATAGHEVACHGYRHQMITTISRVEFAEDLRRAKGILEDLGGVPSVGFRAPSWSIVAETMWALDVLIEQGFEYDSSIFPIHHDRYGVPGAARFPHMIERPAGRIREIPPSTLRVLGLNFPFAGGGYLRLFPLGLVLWALKRINRGEKQPCVIYVHPWEVDPAQPCIQSGRLTRFRHRVGLATTLPKLRRLLGDFDFVRMCELAKR